MQSKTKIVDRLLAWFGQNARDLPWRRTHDPYAIWVSEIMLQQTQVKTVLPYWERWMTALPNIRAIAKASPKKIHKLWEGLGYYTRVRNMQRAAQIVVKEHRGEFPSEFDAVLALPGIGRYTAGAICSIAFNQPTPILDGNVIRVLTRLFGIKGDPRKKKTNAKLWQIAQDLVGSAETEFCRSPRKAAHSAVGWQDQGLLTSALTIRSGCSQLNQSLMELGALVCAPKNPRCSECPLKSDCVAHQKNLVDIFPNIPRRAPATTRRFIAFVVERQARFLVRQRPAGIVNAHLWEFPNVEVNGQTDIEKIAQDVLGFRPKSVELSHTIKHTITRYRITLDVFRGVANGKGLVNDRGHWLHPRQLRRLPFASAHKKILHDL